MYARTETEREKSLVIGGTGLVGGFIVDHLVRGGARPLVLSRSHQPQGRPDVDWFCGDLETPDRLKFPAFSTLYCTAEAVLLANALPLLCNPSLRRVVAFSSTSVLTKQDLKSPPSGKRSESLPTPNEASRRCANATRSAGPSCVRR